MTWGSPMAFYTFSLGVISSTCRYNLPPPALKLQVHNIPCVSLSLSLSLSYILRLLSKVIFNSRVGAICYIYEWCNKQQDKKPTDSIAHQSDFCHVVVQQLCS